MASTRTALGSRENYFDSDGETYEGDDTDSTGHYTTPFNYKEEKAAFAAYQFLKPIVTKLDPEALFGDPDPYIGEPFEVRALAATLGLRHPTALHSEHRSMPVSDPAIRLAQQAGTLAGAVTVPGGDGVPDGAHAQFDDADDRGHDRQSFGQRRRRTRYNEETGVATGPYFEALTFEEFMAALDAIVPYWQSELGLSDDRVGDLKHDARCMKSSGDWMDLDILSQLMTELVRENSQAFRGLEQVRAAQQIAGD